MTRQMAYEMLGTIIKAVNTNDNTLTEKYLTQDYTDLRIMLESASESEQRDIAIEYCDKRRFYKLKELLTDEVLAGWIPDQTLEDFDWVNPFNDNRSL